MGYVRLVDIKIKPQSRTSRTRYDMYLFTLAAHTHLVSLYVYLQLLKRKSISLHSVTPCTCFEVIFWQLSLLCVCRSSISGVFACTCVFRHGMTMLRFTGALEFAPLIRQVRGCKRMEGFNPSNFLEVTFPVSSFQISS